MSTIQSTPPRVLRSFHASDKPVSTIGELTVKVLKVMAIAAIVFGFIFEIHPLMIFGVTIGVFAFAVHMSLDKHPKPSFMQKAFSFFVPTPPRKRPTTPSRGSTDLSPSHLRKLQKRPSSCPPGQLPKSRSTSDLPNNTQQALKPVRLETIDGSPATGPKDQPLYEITTFNLKDPSGDEISISSSEELD